MSLNVANLVATIELQAKDFEQGVTGARTSMTSLDRALAGAQAASAAIGFDPKVAAGAGAAAGKVDSISDAAKRAASGVDRIGSGAAGAATDVAKIDTALGGTEKAAERAASEIDKAGKGVESSLGGEAGGGAGGNFVQGFADKVGGLGSKTGPVGGAILGIAALGLTAGALLVGAIKEGMQTEVSQDMLQAQLGLDEATVRKIGLAAGEAFANSMGESVDANMGAAKAAIQSGLLDPAANGRDTQAIIEQLSGVSGILGEEIPAVAKAAGKAITTGIATDASSAFDLLVVGSQKGLNVSEDWLDTLNEYSTQFRKLGLDGPHAIGLMAQAVKGGARDTDLAADALKEFSIRAVDGSTASAAGFAALGLDAQKMTSQIASGGSHAATGLGTVLTKLHDMKDPVAQAAAATALFGTQSEDLGKALFSMDFGTAAAGLDGYAGAAGRAIATVNGNAASSVTGAINSLSVAKQGLEAALAQAVGPYIAQFADSIANNRAGVIDFFTMVGNGALDVGIALAHMAAGAARMTGDLVASLGGMASGALNALSPLISGMGGLLSAIPGMKDIGTNLIVAGVSMKGFADKAGETGASTKTALYGVADSIDTTVIPALERTKTKFGELVVPQRASAALNDQMTKITNDVNALGVAADGTRVALSKNTVELDLSNAAQADLATSMAGMLPKMQEQIRLGALGGQSLGELTRNYYGNRDAIIANLTSMGMSKDKADALVSSYGLVPRLVSTTLSQPGMPQAKSELDTLLTKITGVPDYKTVTASALTQPAIADLEGLGFKVGHMPDGSFTVVAQTQAAEDQLAVLTRSREVQLQVTLAQVRANLNLDGTRQEGSGTRLFGNGYGAGFANGGIAEYYASGGVRSENHVAQIAPAGANRHWAEPETGGEGYVPLAPAKRARSLQVMDEIASRFGKQLVPAGQRQGTGGTVNMHNEFHAQQDPRIVSDWIASRIA